MANYSLWVNGGESEDLMELVSELEVEESIDLPHLPAELVKMPQVNNI